MSEYGRVISGGAKMSKGLTKNINGKRDSREDEVERRTAMATAVLNAYKQKNLSSPSTNGIKKDGKSVTFKKATAPTKV
jgi:hypothetical protein